MKSSAFLVTHMRVMPTLYFHRYDDAFATKIIAAAGEELGEPIDVEQFLTRIPPYSGDFAQVRAHLLRAAFRRAAQRDPDIGLVVLGAGFESLAGEVGPRPTWELDLPELQAFKQAVMRRVEDYDDQHVTYVPYDIRSGGLRGVLEANGWSGARRTFVALTGVVYYLQEPQVRALFRQIAGLGPVDLFFDYMDAVNDAVSGASAEVKRETGENLHLHIDDIAPYLEGFGIVDQRRLGDVLTEEVGGPVDVGFPVSFVHCETARRGCLARLWPGRGPGG